MKTCYYCHLSATQYSDPPMCDKHLDLAVFIGYLQEHDQPITIDSIQALLAKARANNGLVYLTPEDVPALLPGLLRESEVV